MEEAARAADFDFGGMAVVMDAVGVFCFIMERRACGTATLCNLLRMGLEGLGAGIQVGGGGGNDGEMHG